MTIMTDKERRLRLLLAESSAAEAFNGNVLIAAEGEVVYEGVLGYADRATGRRLTPHTMFNAASVAKTFTSAAVLLLHERGLLTLDSLITDWFPDMPYRGVAVRHLLAHTSGIPNYIRPVRTGQFDGCWSLKKLATNEEMLERIGGLSPQVDFAPGDRNEYSNTGYLLLALLIEEATGTPFGAFLEQEILKPCGLTRTAENSDADRASKLEDYAIGRVRTEEGQYALPFTLPGMEFCYYLDELQGDGNIHTTTRDLLQWDRMLRSGQLLDDRLLMEAYTPAVTRLEGAAPNGLGWFVEHSTARGTMVEHSGYWPGYSAVFRRYLELDRTIILLSNEEYDNSYKVREELVASIERVVFDM